MKPFTLTISQPEIRQVRSDVRQQWPVVLLLFFVSTFVGFPFDHAPPIILESPHPEVEGEFGSVVTYVPDVNGDGKADIVVCARWEDPDDSPSNAGRVYLFDGATRALLRELKSPNEVVDGGFGFSASGIDDINADGRGDLIVGTAAERVVYVMDGATGEVIHTLFTGGGIVSLPDVNGDGLPDIASMESFGVVDIQSGGSGEWLTTLTSPNEETRGFFGFSFSGIQDVNGDGRGDVIVGAPDEDLPTTPERPRTLANAGRAYIFDGASGAVLHTLTSPNERANGGFGRSVTGIPDLNGDGRGDVVAMSGPAGQGRVYTFDGATGKLLRTMQAADYVGGVPDVNRDGRWDLLVAAFSATNPRARLLDGESGELLFTFRNYQAPGLYQPLTGLPDLNGDGRGEILIAAPYATSTSTPRRSQAGQVFLYLSDPRPKPPKPAAVGWSAEGFKLRLTGEPATHYELQSSEDLTTWTTVIKQTHTSKVTEFLDVKANNGSLRFYRTRTEQ